MVSRCGYRRHGRVPLAGHGGDKAALRLCNEAVEWKLAACVTRPLQSPQPFDTASGELLWTDDTPIA